MVADENWNSHLQPDALKAPGRLPPDQAGGAADLCSLAQSP